MLETRRQWSEIIILGAGRSCPWSERTHECPLRDFLTLALDERAVKMEHMSDEHLYGLAAYHDSCSGVGLTHRKPKGSGHLPDPLFEDGNSDS
ncbi:hypothetical protein BVY04_02490 [bacterium M21]|nr:hypothetical protein BVY04_02490 [bacterium M21]